MKYCGEEMKNFHEKILIRIGLIFLVIFKAFNKNIPRINKDIL